MDDPQIHGTIEQLAAEEHKRPDALSRCRVVRPAELVERYEQ